jgi:hypothetical protein
VVKAQIGCPLPIQTDHASRTTFQANVLTSFPEGLKVLTVDVGVTIIEEIEHLLNGVDVFGNPGPLCTFVSGLSLGYLESWLVSTLNGLNESFDPDRGLRLGEAGVGGIAE